MQIPKSFDDALNRAYYERSQLNNLFIEQKDFIRRLAKHALRYRPWGLVSDEDDLYQEACCWILDTMWDWDPSRGIPLSKYVVYNVGTRLRNQVSQERAEKRVPKRKPLSLVSVQTDDQAISKLEVSEESIPSPSYSPDELVEAKELYEMVTKDLNGLACELLDALLLEDGNLHGAARRLREQCGYRRGSQSLNAFRLRLRCSTRQALASNFRAIRIMQGDRL